MKTFQSVVCNLLPAGCRVDQLEGKDYTVVPMVILTEGVHAGSQGPLYYPKEELSKTPAVWNHKPIVVYHPSVNGQGVSACDPVILNSRKVGVMMNTKWDKGKLKSEAWLDKDKANTVDERVMNAVEAKEMMELSTGLYIDVDDEEGQWKGEEYEGVARNYRPDHLALLPDQIGACSIADGAGLLRNQRDAAQKLMEKGKTLLNQGKEEDDEDMQAEGRRMMKKAKKMLTENEMSFSNIQSALAAALREKLGEEPYIWVMDVYSDFVIYERENKLWRMGYTSNNSGVSLGDEDPVAVKRVTEYRTESGSFVGNTNPEETMNKKQVVDAIIASNTGWKETDRPVLMSLNEDQLKSIQNGSVKPAGPTAKAKEKIDALIAADVGLTEEDRPQLNAFTEAQLDRIKIVKAPVTPKTEPAPAPAGNTQQNQPVTLQNYISAAPPEIRDMLNDGIATHNAEKAKLVEFITANKNNSFSKEELLAKNINELKRIAKLITPEQDQTRVAVYHGQAPVTGNEAEEPMAIPALTFEARK